MNNIKQIRGALLEEAVLFLLEKVGYKVVDYTSPSFRDTDEMKKGCSGLEVRGRGMWHQIDGVALWPYSPAFMYPMRLIVEAKCYLKNPVEIQTVRNAVGVLKDISENYFTYISNDSNVKISTQRYNTVSAIFSTSGYTAGAIKYAIAHQIFLIQYDNIKIIKDLINMIKIIDKNFFCDTSHNAIISEVRNVLHELLSDRSSSFLSQDPFNDDGFLLLKYIVDECQRIKGSYFGMLQGRWPMHLLQNEPLPPSAFMDDKVKCKITGNNDDGWSFTPVNVSMKDENFFKLEFSLPSEIAKLVAAKWDDPVEVANIKQEHFSYINLSGIIGGIFRNVRLELDQDWIKRYIEQNSALESDPL